MISVWIKEFDWFGQLHFLGHVAKLGRPWPWTCSLRPWPVIGYPRARNWQPMACSNVGQLSTGCPCAQRPAFAHLCPVFPHFPLKMIMAYNLILHRIKGYKNKRLTVRIGFPGIRKLETSLFKLIPRARYCTRTLGIVRVSATPLSYHAGVSPEIPAEKFWSVGRSDIFDG